MADHDPSLRGVGGWLAFFLVTLGIFTPLAFIVTGYQVLADPQVAVAYGDVWPTLRNAEIAFIAFVLAILWFACWRFLNVFNWTTVRIGIATLWVLAPLNVFGETFLVSRIAGLDFNELLAETPGPDMVRPFIYATIWTAYLLHSQRVRNTYGGGADESVGEVFG